MCFSSCPLKQHFVLDLVENCMDYLLKKNSNENIKNCERYLQNTKRVILYKEKKMSLPKLFQNLYRCSSLVGFMQIWQLRCYSSKIYIQYLSTIDYGYDRKKNKKGIETYETMKFGCFLFSLALGYGAIRLKVPDICVFFILATTGLEAFILQFKSE